VDSFLSNWQFSKSYNNGSFSQWLPVSSGVPQGSILGRLLFLLYVNDIQEVVKHFTVKLFADDVALYKDVQSKMFNQWLTVICYSRT